MMHKDLFIAVVKSAGKILRERDFTKSEATVHLPFDSELSISMKNLHTETAAVGITIDGVDVLNGRSLFVLPNKELELERFLEDLNVGNKFLFIQKTEEISEFRGDKLDDGFIRVVWQYEKAKVVSTRAVRSDFVQPYDPEEYDKILAAQAKERLRQEELRAEYQSKCSGETATFGTLKSNRGWQDSQGPQGCCGTQGTQGTQGSGGILRSMDFSATFLSSSPGVAAVDQSCNMNINGFKDHIVGSGPVLEDGITVKGSISQQAFKEDSIGELELEKHVFIFRLKGFVQNKPVLEPLTTKQKLQCNTCGRVSSSANNNCPKCGTALAVKVGA